MRRRLSGLWQRGTWSHIVTEYGRGIPRRGTNGRSNWVRAVERCERRVGMDPSNSALQVPYTRAQEGLCYVTLLCCSDRGLPDTVPFTVWLETGGGTTGQEKMT